MVLPPRALAPLPVPASRSRPAARSSCLALAALLLSGACSERAPLEPTPDAPLILVVLDTLRADHLSCYGYERSTSPRLDALAAESLLFEDVLACSSSTAPSQVTLMTGVLPRVHGIDNDLRRVQSPRAPMLAELLSGEGYVTTAFADGGRVAATAGFDRGFDRWDSRYEWWDHKVDRVLGWLDSASPEASHLLFVHTYGVHVPYLPGPGHDLFSDPGYAGPLATAVPALQARVMADRPVLLEHLVEPFRLSVGELSAADRQHLVDLYDGAIHRVDAGLGRLVDGLRAEGWLDRAWLVVTSDHGEAFGEHGTLQHRQVHQEELAVPLIIRPPGGLPGGRRVSRPVSQLDLPPTLLHVLGRTPPPVMQGRSLLPLDGRETTRFATGGEGLRLDVVVTGGRKLIASTQHERACFDLDVDRLEQHDLLAAVRGAPAPAWLVGLRAQLEGMRVEAAALREVLGDPSQGAELSPEQVEQLEALGYLR